MVFFRSLFTVAVVTAAQGASSFSPQLPPIGVKTHPISPSCSRSATVTITTLHSIVSEVMDEMKIAMKAKDAVTLGTIRLMRSAFANGAIELKTDELSDDQAQNVLRKMAKMRQESIDMFSSGGAEDRADAERAELVIIERWLPKLADEDQTRVWVQVAILAVGGDNIGKVMGALMKDHKAELDGKLAQTIVKEELKS